jgi:hypothetical protein
MNLENNNFKERYMHMYIDSIKLSIPEVITKLPWLSLFIIQFLSSTSYFQSFGMLSIMQGGLLHMDVHVIFIDRRHATVSTILFIAIVLIVRMIMSLFFFNCFSLLILVMFFFWLFIFILNLFLFSWFLHDHSSLIEAPILRIIVLRSSPLLSLFGIVIVIVAVRVSELLIAILSVIILGLIVLTSEYDCFLVVLIDLMQVLTVWLRIGNLVILLL